MITLLASIAGFVSSIIPEILKLLKDRSDKQHELNMFDRHIASSKNNSFAAIQQDELNKNFMEQLALYSTYHSGINWVDALNASVRPILAYCFFTMYALLKFFQYKNLEASATIAEHIEVIWSVDDQAIFAGIISFYYGQRTFTKLWKK